MNGPSLIKQKHPKSKRKSVLRRKLKASTLDVQIKQFGLKVSNSKVFRAENFKIVDI